MNGSAHDYARLSPVEQEALEEMLSAFALGALLETEAEDVARHLSACPQCRVRAEELATTAGLLAVAIPIVVHLVHRERKEPLAFPSLMFLRRVPFRSARRQRIRYWLLFLLRTAALLLIATAFARPWIDRPQGSAARSGEAYGLSPSAGVFK